MPRPGPRLSGKPNRRQREPLPARSGIRRKPAASIARYGSQDIGDQTARSDLLSLARLKPRRIVGAFVFAPVGDPVEKLKK